MSTPLSNNPPPVVLPNVRKLFLPDPDYFIFDADLSGADAQVVAWEADDTDLKAAFRAGLDVHAKNAEDMLGEVFTRLPGKGVKGSPYDRKRQQNKVAVHLTNYGGSARTLAITQGWLVIEAERFQSRWFSLHPGIEKTFHGGVRAALASSRTVYNRFGFPRPYFDRIDSCFGEALAWIPQSTVAINTYLGAFALEAAFPAVEFLLQVHDSLTFQFPKAKAPSEAEIAAALTVVTPYEDPLRIPWKITKSDKSWGDC